MLFIPIILTLFTLVISGITTIPLLVGVLAIFTVASRKSWVFFLALAAGLFLDLISMRPLGYSGLVLTVFVFLLFLYERKFETRTSVFIFFSTFFWGLIYLRIFDYQQIFLQALINSLVTVIFFKLLWLKLGPPSETL
jgi:hypothetical protein